MIESKKINIVAAFAICLTLTLTTALVGFGDSSAAKEARQAKYVTGLFGDGIISIDIIVDENEWNDMIANAQAKEYIMADVVVNGVKYQYVGIRTKGNASLSQVTGSDSPERYSLRIKFDEYINNQTCLGLDVLILNNMISDPSYMKEYMSQDLMRYIGVEAPLTNYADISVNGEGFGFYLALEYYGDSYIKRVHEDTTGNLYSVKTMQMGGDRGGNMGGENFQWPRDNQAANAPASEDWNDRAAFVGMGGGSTGGSLQYTDDNISSYSAIFDNAHGTVSESDQKKVVEAIKNLSTGTDLEKYFDVDEILRYFAAHTVVVNLDSYYSNMAQNYFIYERNGQISILPWDYHLSYGTFQAGDADDIVNFPIDTPVSGVTMESRPLLNMLLSNEEYLAKYHQYLNEIVEGYFNSGLFEETVRNLQTKIADYVKNDPSALSDYEEFEAGVDTLIQLNLLRAESIEGQLDGSISSTTDGQKADSGGLIAAADIDMSNLGTMNMGGGRGNGGGMGNFPGGDFEMPDMNVMMQAMQIIESAGGEITDEIKTQLTELGLTEEQITGMAGMAAGGMRGGFPGGMQGGNFPGDGNLPDNGNPPDENLTDENIPAGNLPDGNSPDVNLPDGNLPDNANPPDENFQGMGNQNIAADSLPANNSPFATGGASSGGADRGYAIYIAVLTLVLVCATVFAAKLRRSY